MKQHFRISGSLGVTLALILPTGEVCAQILRPDLAARTLTKPLLLLDGKTYEFTARIKNIGIAASPSCKVGFYVNSVRLHNKKLAALKIQEATTVKFTYKAPTNRDSGVIVFRVSADSTNQVAEILETNNDITKSVTYINRNPTSKKPDLAITGVSQDLRNSWSLPQQFRNSFTVAVANTGTLHCPGFECRVVLSKDLVMDSSDLLLSSDLLPPLPINATYPHTTTPITLPNALKPGAYHVLIALDPLLLIPEFTKANNRTSLAVTLYIPGNFSSFGAGCAGSNGLPSQAATMKSKHTDPFPGTVAAYSLSGGPASSAAILFLGFSNSRWGAFKLPLPLAMLGAPGCTILTEPALQLSTATNSAAKAVIPIRLPSDTSLVNATFFTQFLGLDPKANKLGSSFSNGVATTIGTMR